MIRISHWQIFVLMMLFEIGSTTLFALGIDAGRDAWIAILLAMLAGFILIWIYTQIQSYYPDKNLAEILVTVLGKWIGGPLVLFYALEFFWVGTLNFREFGEITSMILLPDTPILVILIIFMLIALYVLFCGVEVLARLGEVMFPIVAFFLLVVFILPIFSGDVDFTRLQPVLGNGIQPVLDAAFPAVVNFPFGEAVVFLMFWKYVEKKERIRRTAFAVIGASGLLLCCSLIIIVSVLGIEYTKNSEIPLFEVIKLINIGDIITNLDAIATLILFMGGFFKMTLHFYGGVLAVQSLFKIKNERWLLVVCAILFIWFSFTYYEHLVFHRWVGLEFSISYWYSPFSYFEIYCPILILFIIWLKIKRH